MKNIRSSLLLLTALVLSACGGEPPDNRPGQPVAHRRAAFKEILKAFEPMGVMFRTGSFDAAKFQQLTSELMARRDAPWDYFLPDTLYPPSHAKAEVWSEPEKFARAKRDFYAATDRLAAVAGTTDKRTAEAAWSAVETTCKGCHQDFKTR